MRVHNVILIHYTIIDKMHTRLHYLTEVAPPETDENSSLNRDLGSRVRGLGGGIINGTI